MLHIQAGKLKFFWHSPELGSLLYMYILYKIPLTQACFALVSQPDIPRLWCFDTSVTYPNDFRESNLL